MDDTLRKSALDYHRLPRPGKISVVPTKGLVNQRDLALAYTPGVAAAFRALIRLRREPIGRVLMSGFALFFAPRVPAGSAVGSVHKVRGNPGVK